MTLPSSDDLSSRKVFHQQEKEKKLKVDNSRFISKIEDILSDNRFERSLEQREDEIERIRRGASLR